jgi:hypothetical protein
MVKRQENLALPGSATSIGTQFAESMIEAMREQARQNFSLFANAMRFWWPLTERRPFAPHFEPNDEISTAATPSMNKQPAALTEPNGGDEPAIAARSELLALQEQLAALRRQIDMLSERSETGQQDQSEPDWDHRTDQPAPRASLSH